MLNFITHFAFLSSTEPKNIKEACVDEFYIITMQEELNQFVRNDVSNLFHDR